MRIKHCTEISYPPSTLLFSRCKLTIATGTSTQNYKKKQSGASVAYWPIANDIKTRKLISCHVTGW